MNHRPHWMQPTRVIGTAMAVLLAVTIGTAHAQNAPQAPQAPMAQLPGAQLPGADVMRHVSPEAELVLIVPSLARFSEALATLGQSLNLGLPEMDDALGIFKRQSGMVQGVNDEGAMLVVVLNLAEAITQKTEPAMVMLMPVRDYAAFVGNFAGQGDAPVTELVLRGGQTGYAKQLDGYAVMGRDRALVEAYVGGADPAQLVTQMGAVGARHLSTGDVSWYVNIEAIAPALLASLDEGFAMMRAEMTAEMQADAMGEQAQQAAVVDSIVNLYEQMVRGAIQSSRSFVMTVDLAGEGVSLTQALHYKADSPMAGLFTGQAGQAGALMARLPDQPYILASTFDLRAVALDKLTGPFMELVAQWQPLLAEASPENAALLKGVFEQWIPLIEKTHGSASAFYVPAADAMMTGSYLRFASVTQTEAPAAYRDANRDYARIMNEIAQREPSAMRMTYLENVLQIDGHPVDQVQATLPPELQAEAGYLQGLMGGYLTFLDASVLQTSVGDEPLLRATIQSASAGDGLGAAGGMQQVREQALGGANMMEVYLSVNGMVQTANMFLPMMGVEVAQAPADLPPLAFGLGVEQNTLVGRTYVAHETSKFIGDAVRPWLGMLDGAVFDGMMHDPGVDGPPRPPF